MILFFSVDKQIIKRNDNESVVQDSQNYLYAQFNFSDEWTGQITAVFKGKDGQTFNVLLDDGCKCLVPWEVLTQCYFEISVFCGDLITANVVRIYTIESGYEIGEAGRVPTPDIYTQIVEQINEISDEVLTPEEVNEIISTYVDENGLTNAEDVETIVATYVTEHHDELKGDTGPQGPQGPTGATPIISATGSVTNTTGTPSVTITKTGTAENPNFDFAFSNIKGAKGDDGADGSVVTVTQTLQSGTKIGSISVDGNSTDLFAPSGGGSTHYAIMPTDSELLEMANGTVFETDGFWTQTDGHGGKYMITTNAYLVGGMLKITDGTTTKYLVALENDNNLLSGYIDPTRYGVREADSLAGTLTPSGTYATANSDIMSRITNHHFGSIIKFPAGKFVFESPLSISARQYSLIGATHPITRTTATGNYEYDLGTILAFPFLTNGQTAISMSGGSTIENIAIYGNKNTYSFVIDRTVLTTAPQSVITETIAESEGVQIKCKAINKAGGGNIKNVFIFNFYTGITCSGNTFIKDFYARQVHYGINCENDTKMEGIGGFDVHTLIRIRGALCSVLHERVDSCVHALEIVNGSGLTITDVDGDWCTDSLIAIGDDTTAGTVSSVIFDGVHGRCNTLKAYDSNQQATPLDVRTLPSIDGYGIIRVYSNINFSDSRIVVNSHGGARPADGSEDPAYTYLTPDILFTFSSGANDVLDNITFVLAKGIYSIDDVLRVIQTRSGFTAKVEDASGDYYIEGSAVTENVLPVEISSATNNEVLAYDGEKWKNENGNVSFVHAKNLLQLPDGEFSINNLNVVIKDNIITLNTTNATTKKIYIKLTNGIALNVDTAPTSWRSETVGFMEAGKTYGIRDFSFGDNCSDKGLAASVRDSSGASVLSRSRTNPVQFSASPAYIQLFVESSSIFVDYKVGVSITENEVPEDWEDITAYHDYWKQYISQCFLDTEAFITSTPPSSGYVTQGMCTDGTYLYTCLINGGDDSANTYVYKYNLADGSLVTSVNSYSLGHCNSMTYCPKDGYIYCIPLDNVGTVHRINASDLSYVDSFTVDLSDVYSAYTGIGAISYNESRDVFVCLIRGDRKGYAIINRKGDLLNIVWTRKFYTMEGIASTLASCYADDFFIYQAYYTYNGIQVFTYNGDYVGNIILPSAMSSYEFEDISIDGDYMYINIHQSGNPHVAKLAIHDLRYACILKR